MLAIRLCFLIAAILTAVPSITAGTDPTLEPPAETSLSPPCAAAVSAAAEAFAAYPHGGPAEVAQIHLTSMAAHCNTDGPAISKMIRERNGGVGPDCSEFSPPITAPFTTPNPTCLIPSVPGGVPACEGNASTILGWTNAITFPVDYRILNSPASAHALTADRKDDNSDRVIEGQGSLKSLTEEIIWDIDGALPYLIWDFLGLPMTGTVSYYASCLEGGLLESATLEFRGAPIGLPHGVVSSYGRVCWIPC